MGDSSVTKVQADTSPTGAMGQRYLASGTKLGMRLWVEEPSERKPEVARDYETVGYVISGSAVLHTEGQQVRLDRSDSWVVPAGASHTYEVVDRFTAVEATAPPAQVHGRDDPPA